MAALALAAATVTALLTLGQTASPSSAASAVSAPSVPVARSTEPGIQRLVVYGHSMPLGGGASNPSLGYVPLTAAALEIVVVNRAEGASGAANATKAMQAMPAAGPQDAVVLHTGMNDLVRRGDAAVRRGRQAIHKFLAGTAGAGSRVVILECQPGSWEDTPAGRDLQSAYEAWNAMLREESLQQDVAVLDTCATWDTARYNDDRRYHPNDAGHALLAAELTAVLARS